MPKKLLKLVNVSRSYSKNKSGTMVMDHCVVSFKKQRTVE